MTVEGSVFQRKDGRWVAQYRDAKAKVRYLYRRSKAEAKKALREALRDRDEGCVQADKLTVGLYLEGWLSERRNTVSGRTWRVQESMLRNRVKDELRVVAHEAVELRAGFAGQGGKSIAQRGSCVAVEVPFARETAPPSEDGQGDHLACTQGCLRAWFLCWRMEVAEVVDHNVKCGEEGVLRSSMRGRVAVRL